MYTSLKCTCLISSELAFAHFKFPLRALWSKHTSVVLLIFVLFIFLHLFFLLKVFSLSAHFRFTDVKTFCHVIFIKILFTKLSYLILSSTSVSSLGREPWALSRQWRVGLATCVPSALLPFPPPCLGLGHGLLLPKTSYFSLGFTHHPDTLPILVNCYGSQGPV